MRRVIEAGKFILLTIVLLTFVLFGFTNFADKIGNFIDIPSAEITYQNSCENGCIKIASWNIQNFGPKKASDSETMEKIADIMSGYDIIAVQEISNVNEMSDIDCFRNEDSCPDHENCNLITNSLQEYLNDRLNLNYGFVFSPQVSDERYLYVYNMDKVSLDGSRLAKDMDDSLPVCDLKQENTGLMIRQPFIGKFSAGNFSFVLMSVHTSPKINFRELEGLKVFYDITSEEEENVIIIGDLNADCSYLREDDEISLRESEFTWVVDDLSDTTVSKSDCAYDRIIFEDDAKQHHTKRWGIYRNITEDISDHYLIWTEFRTS